MILFSVPIVCSQMCFSHCFGIFGGTVGSLGACLGRCVPSWGLDRFLPWYWIVVFGMLDGKIVGMGSSVDLGDSFCCPPQPASGTL